MSDAVQQIANLSSEEKRALLARLLKKSAHNSKEFPLSYAQERLWFLDQLAPGDVFYNIPAVLRMRGELDIEILAQSITEVVRRHEVLRTTFHSQGGVPQQAIAPPMPVAVPVVDLREVAEENREAEVERLVCEETQRPFDLGQLPLFRLRIVRIREAEYVIAVTLHHIVADGWSIGVFLREVQSLYAAFVAGQPSPLSELPVQYSDYAVWQRGWLQGEVLKGEMGYWRKRLQGAAMLELPTDRPRPRLQNLGGATYPLVIEEEIYRGLKALSRQEGATLFMTLIAAFKVLLYRYTGQEDISVGTPIANRRRAEIEGLIGFFVNTLVLRTDLHGELSFKEVLKRVREAALEAYAHQDLPFEKLVAELRPVRDLSRNPLFQVMFILQNAPLPKECGFLGLEMIHGNIGGGASNFDLSLSLMELDKKLIGGFEYPPELFDRATIERLVVHYKTLLTGIVSNPCQPLWSLPLLTQPERHQLLQEWNSTHTAYPQECVHTLFEAQAVRAPEAIAVVWGEQKISYQELNVRANQVARYLRRQGVGPEIRVGLCVERSIEMVVGMLGILKAGGAYVPLDPEYPAERLRWMLKDAGTSVLLGQEGVLSQLPSYSGQMVCLDRDWAVIAREAAENLPNQCMPENLAYVMYTSGSTGFPKGVMIEQRAMSGYVETARRMYGLQSTDRCLQFASLSFDTSVEEILPCLVSGGSLILRSEEMLRSVDAFQNQCTKWEVSVLNLPTAYWHEMVGEWDRQEVEFSLGIRLVIIGGERAQAGKLRSWHQHRGNGVVLKNTYGPTETTVVATVADLTVASQNREYEREVPIGRPIANARVYILDRAGEPVPVGVSGEIHIGGAGLARGYLNRPELTAERFVPDPFSEEAGNRLYRTGDLGRYLKDGTIEFLGRADSQVKLRGYRIELGEIETALREHGAVEEAAVVMKEERLVAYVVPRAGTPVSSTQLRHYLKEKLPEYMLPGAIVPIEALPLNPNGKVDRSALPSLDAGHLKLKSPSAAPKNPIEEILIAIWEEVLGLSEVGVEDDFFELGGHSLLATQIAARIRDRLGLELPLRSFFEKPTILRLASSIVGKGRDQTRLPPVRPVSQNQRKDLPITSAQERLWFLDQIAPGNACYNIPIVMRLRGQLHVDALARSITEVVRRHEVLRTTFRAEVGAPRQVVQPPKKIEVTVQDVRVWPQKDREAEIERLIAEEAGRRFDLSREQWRMKVIRAGERDHIVAITVHHIIADGWSIGVLLEEVQTLYGCFIEGRPSPLTELLVQYGDFAVWQRDFLCGEFVAQEVGYWRQRLKGAVVLDLPTDRPRPAIHGFGVARHPVVIEGEISKGLKNLSRQEGATLFMTLIAAFKVLLYRYTGQEDISVGTPIANRRRPEIEGLIGLFANTLVLRTDLHGELSFKEVLKRVREAALEAYAHQDLPFEKLVAELRPVRDLSRNPLFQVMFVLQNTPMPEGINLQGLELVQAEIKEGTSNIDLILSLTDYRGTLQGVFAYAPELFDKITIARLAQQLQALLAGVVANPDRHIWDLPLITAIDAESTSGRSRQDQKECHD